MVYVTRQLSFFYTPWLLISYILVNISKKISLILPKKTLKLKLLFNLDLLITLLLEDIIVSNQNISLKFDIWIDFW